MSAKTISAIAPRNRGSITYEVDGKPVTLHGHLCEGAGYGVHFDAGGIGWVRINFYAKTVESVRPYEMAATLGRFVRLEVEAV